MFPWRKHMELRELTDSLQEAITSTFRALKTKEVKIMIDMLLLPKRRTQEYYNGKDDSELTYKIYVACVTYLRNKENAIIRKYIANLEKQLNNNIYAFCISDFLGYDMRKDTISQLFNSKLINPVNVNLLILLHLNGIPINIRVPSNAKYKLDANVAIIILPLVFPNILVKLSPTILSDFVYPCFSTFVESTIIANTPFLPSSANLAKSINSPSIGV